MNRQDLGKVTKEAFLVQHILTKQVRDSLYDDKAGFKELDAKLHLGEAVAMHDELKEHLRVYYCILEIC